MQTRISGAGGFSLVEMAVVLTIFGLLLGGLLMVMRAQMASQYAQQAQRQLLEARQALIGFAAIHGRLPCPASPTLASGAAGAGIEQPPTATGCSGGPEGVLPWATLGLPEADPWARRLRYRVAPLYSRSVIPRLPTQYGCAVPPPSPPVNAAFALCTPGDIEIRSAAAGAPLAVGVASVIVSHGPNGFGARLGSGAPMPGSAAADEQENHDGDTLFVERTPTEAFDDLLTALPPSLLMQAMLQAGRLP